MNRGFKGRSVTLNLLCLAGLMMLAEGSVSDDLKEVQDDFWQWRLEVSPEFATTIGVNNYNDNVDLYGLDHLQSSKTSVDVYLKRLDAINKDDLPAAQQIDYKMLQSVFSTFADAYTWREYGALNPINFMVGRHIVHEAVIDSTPFDTIADFENYITRVGKYGQQLDQQIVLLQKAIAVSRTLNIVSVEKVPDQLQVMILDNPEESIFYLPLKELLEDSSVPNSDWDYLRGSAKIYVKSAMDGLQRLHDYLVDDYIPAVRSSWGVDGWSPGGEYYQACLTWHLSLDMTPEEVHQKGLDEVERIRGEMQKIMDKQGYAGTISEYFIMLRNGSQFHPGSQEELLQGYDDIIHKRILPKINDYFDDYPDLPVRVEPMTTDGPVAMYVPGSTDGSRPGTFYVNVLNPNDTVTYQMAALSIHEAIPGHHLQVSYAQKTDLPEFRRNIDVSKLYQVPLQFPFYTSYVEGWALYAEYLGEEMGLYENDYELMGRFSSEIFRACRLVVDTGLHAKQWSREQAIQYLLDTTSTSRSSAEVEIDRYITWPGQACAYKIGEIKIKELRLKAETELGDKFNLKAFHSVLLKDSTVPLHVLEELVDDWVKVTVSSAVRPSPLTGMFMFIAFVVGICYKLLLCF